MMNKVDVILEQFDMDPLGISVDSYYTQSMFEEGQQFLEATVNEARTGVTKKNFAQKIWETIKKIWAWCCKQFGRFINWLKKVFRRKGAKTADQVADEIIGGSEGSGSETPPGTNAPTTAPLTQGGSSTPDATSAKENPISSIKVELPSNPASEAPPEPSIDVLIKPIMLSYDSVKDSFGISIYGAKNYGDGKVKGQKTTAPHNFYNIVLLIDQPDIRNLLKEAIMMIKDKNVGNDFINQISKFDNVMNSRYDINEKYVVSFKQLTEFQQWLNEMMEIIGAVNIGEDTVFQNPSCMQVFNNVASYCAKLQMSMNLFTRVAAEVHKIDARYIGSVKTTETLDKFIKALIDSGIPPKYIGYNAYLVCDPALKGSKGDENNPIWGQSRLVLFPDNAPDDIIKVALSGWGVQSNKSEYATSQQFTKQGGEKFISVTKSVGGTGATIVSERVDANGKSIPGDTINRFIRELNSFIANAKLPISIGDLHGGNVGTKDGHVVALDYAWSDRKSTA